MSDYVPFTKAVILNVFITTAVCMAVAVVKKISNIDNPLLSLLK